MKKIFVIMFMAFASFAANAQFGAGEKSFGAKLGYASQNKSAVAGLVFQYAFDEHFRISPELGFAIRNNSEDAFMLDLNFHAPFEFVESQQVAIYPLVGVAYNSWSLHNMDGGPATIHERRFGVNVGAGFDYRCSDEIRLNIEGKYTLIKSFSAFYLTAGVSYIF